MTKTKLESDCKSQVTLKRLPWLFTLMLMMVGFSGWGQTYGTDFSQGSNNNGSAGLGNLVWINGIIQQSNSRFYEGQTIYQRFFLMNIPRSSTGEYKLQISHQATKGGIHAYDFITAWPQGLIRSNQIAAGTYNNVNECNNLGSKVNSTQCGALFGNLQTATAVPSADYGTTASNGDNVASKVAAYDLLNGGAQTARGIQVAATSTSGNGSLTLTNPRLVFIDYSSGSDQYANYELRFQLEGQGTGNFNLLVLIGGHLAVTDDGTDVSYGAGKGSANISGGPYHFKLGNFIVNSNSAPGGTSQNTTSLGSQDNQIKGADILIPPPPCTITPSTNSICAGANAIFIGPPGMADYAWTVSAGASIVSGQGTQTLTVTAASAGTYTVSLVTTYMGTQSVDLCQATLTVNPNAQANAGPNQTKCQTPPSGPTAFTLAGVATNSTSTLWEQTGSTGTANASITTPSSLTSGVNVSGIGTVTLRLTAFGNCASATSTVVLTVNPNAQASAGPNQTLCQTPPSGPTAFTLAGVATNSSSTLWEQTGSTGTASANITTPSSLTSGVSVSGIGTVTLRLTAFGIGGCASATSTVVLTVNANAQANAGPNQTLCQTPPSGPTMFTLAGVATNSSSTLWEQTNATGTASASITTPSSLTSGVSVSGIGTVTLRLTAFANGGCASATSTVVLRVNPNPTANAGSSPTPQCLGATGTNTFSLSGSGTNGTPSWSVVSGTAVVSSGANTYTPTVTTTGSGTFVFRLTVTSDQTPSCGTASSTVSVTVYPLPGAPSPQGADRCGAGILTFTASCDGTIKWYADQFGGTPLHTGNTYTPTASAGQTITVWASCTNANSCEGPRASATATAYGYPTVSATASPTVINLLGPNRNSTLTATGTTATYTWSAVLEFPYSDGSGLLSGTTGATVTVTVPNAVTAYKYMVTAEGPGGCTSTATVIVETIANFTCPEINGPDNLCVGSAGTFTSTAPPQYVTYQWSAEGATVSGTGTSVEITPTVAGVYTVTITMIAESGWPEPVSCTITRTAVDCNLDGCSPGFFKNTTELWNSTSSYLYGQMPAGYQFYTGTGFYSYFGLAPGSISGLSAGVTMFDVISAGGGGCTALARHSVAALLGKAAYPTTYGYNPSGTFAELYNEIKAALQSGNCSSLLASLSYANNLETNCSLLKPLANGARYTRVAPESSQISKLSVLAAPNPFFDKVRFTISTPVDGNVQLEMVNMLGQRLGVIYNGYMKANSSQVVEYNVPASAPQNLIYILRSGNEQISGKLLRANR